MEPHLDFEKPILSLEKKLNDLRELQKQESMDLSTEIKTLEQKVRILIEETFAKLQPWQRVQLSRHPARPYAEDYLTHLFPDFIELHGDRTFGDDSALTGGLATWQGEPVMLLAQQKGRTTKLKLERNFGMARPEGYRKAIRLMDLADRMKIPLITFVDTPGAFPGMDAEERGQSQAIAESIRKMLGLKIPTLTLIIGEGGSGGALALACADEVLMMEYSIYSVISPESCASILWSDSTLASKASEKLKLHAAELKDFGIVDGIVEEPLGGAHRNWADCFARVEKTLAKRWIKLLSLDAEKRVQARHDKFRRMGDFAIAHTASPKKDKS